MFFPCISLFALAGKSGRRGQKEIVSHLRKSVHEDTIPTPKARGTVLLLLLEGEELGIEGLRVTTLMDGWNESSVGRQIDPWKPTRIEVDDSRTTERRGNTIAYGGKIARIL